MRHYRLFSAVAVATLALPALALAQPPQGETKRERAHAQVQERKAAKAHAPPQARQAAKPDRAATHPASQRGPDRAPVRSTAQATPPRALNGWKAPPRGPQRDQAGDQWRQTHQSWDGDAPWRRSHDWWRSDPGFRGFSGLRIGFFFVPELGYISEPRAYRGRTWAPGQYLPAWFRTYRVRNYAHYGLPRPPPGCAWVWLNGNVALIDLTDGYILDIARNVW